jgi:hypothetical protein
MWVCWIGKPGGPVAERSKIEFPRITVKLFGRERINRLHVQRSRHIGPTMAKLRMDVGSPSSRASWPGPMKLQANIF